MSENRRGPGRPQLPDSVRHKVKSVSMAPNYWHRLDMLCGQLGVPRGELIAAWVDEELNAESKGG